MRSCHLWIVLGVLVAAGVQAAEPKAWDLGVDWQIVGPHGLRAAYTRGAGSCDDFAAPVFRPLNFTRRVKLASAYFMNPELAESARVLTLYETSNLSEQDTDVLWTAWNSGNMSLLVPVSERPEEFVPVSRSTLQTINSSCPSMLGMTFRYVRDFSDK